MSRQPGETRDGGNLAKEIKSLKRQLAKANREIERLQGVVEEEIAENTDAAEEPPKPSCPKCESTDLGQISTPNGKRILSCKSCRKWRSRAV